jgi:hypothetical protein
MRGRDRDGVGFGGGLGGGLGVHNGSLIEKRMQQTKAATFCGGRGSAEMADALKCDLFLSIQRCSQAQQTRSLPPWAGIGKVGVLERAMFHPEDEITPVGDWLQGN